MKSTVKLNPQEEKVMLAIWKLGRECIVKDVLETMDEPRPKYTTLASVFRNLEQKGYLLAKKYANVYVYTPVLPKDEYKSIQGAHWISNYFNSCKDMVTFFAQQEQLSAADLQEIIDMIESNPKNEKK